MKLGEWQLSMKESLDDVSKYTVTDNSLIIFLQASIAQTTSSFRAATECDTNWYKAWHAWALINFEVLNEAPCWLE